MRVFTSVWSSKTGSSFSALGLAAPASSRNRWRPKVVIRDEVSSHRRRRRLLLAAVLLAGSLRSTSGLGGDAGGPGAAVITTVEVRGNTRTRDAIVRRELLFAPGDTLRAQALSETARNLRALLFLGSVRLRTESVAPGRVRVVVQVHDRYARATSPLLAGSLGDISYGMVALDYNLLGRGQRARFTAYHDAVSGQRVDAAYAAPRLHDASLDLAFQAGVSEAGPHLDASLSQPFRTLATPWAFGLSVSKRVDRVRLYTGGRQAARYDDHASTTGLWLVRSRGEHLKVRPGFRLTVSDHRFAVAGPFAYRPADRRRVVPSLSLTLWRPRYATDRFIRALGPREDFQVGSWMSLRLGASVRGLGSDRGYVFASLTLAPRYRFGNGWYLLGSLSQSGRWRGQAWNVLTAAHGVVYRRMTTLPLTPTVAARLAFDRIDRPEDAGTRFLLGVDSGVRGYAPRRFDGRRRALVGFEVRPLLADRPAWALGGAAFADAGAAWNDGQTPHWAPSVGAGLRLGLTRLYDTPLLRLDLARGLRQGLWQISFGLGQYY